MTTTTNQTTNTTGTRVRQDIIAVLDEQNAGAIMFWELSGQVDRETMLAAWKAAGLDPKLVPDFPSDQEALRRAMESLREKHVLVRPCGAGYALVGEREEDGQSKLA